MPPTTDREPILHFGYTNREVGFTNPSLAQYDGSPEPVVRELLQNCLDAADRAKRRGVVTFLKWTVANEELPGWIEYLNKFRSAKLHRLTRGEDLAPDERRVIEKIDALLETETIPMLMCIDNGIGLLPERMFSLLNPGHTRNVQGGAGSFGVGHLTAFGASDLRYVLYAAKYLDDAKREQKICSGHAVLATHRTQKAEVVSEDGYLLKSRGQKAFSGESDFYPSNLPPLLEEALEFVDKTGSVVCMAGFNHFNQDSADDAATELAISRVAAMNFVDAINTKKLSVNIHLVEDHRQQVTKVDSSTLGATLYPVRDENRSRSPRGGFIGGADAFRAYETLTLGEDITNLEPDDIFIKFRPLSEGTERSKVHLFRKGMWITSKVPRLESGAFGDVNQFDATISLSSGQFEQLVWSAEGPEHRGLEPTRLSSAERKKLREFTTKIADVLRVRAGKRMNQDTTIFRDFATVPGEATHRIEKLKRDGPVSGGSQNGRGRKGGNKTNGKGSRPQTQGTPRGGNIPDVGTSLLPISVRTQVLEVDFKYRDTITTKTRVGVRVTQLNGSDESCTNPLQMKFLKIERIEWEDQSENSTDENPWEVVITPQEETMRLRIHLEEDELSDTNFVEINSVRRTVAA